MVRNVRKPERKLYRSMLEVSYGDKSKVPEGYTLDKSLSGERVSVLTNNSDGSAYVVHRGTASMKDWYTDTKMALGFEGGNRFKHSAKIQKKAYEKYGKDKITTVGHSLGGRLAEKYGEKSSKTITFNKAVTPRSIKESYSHRRKHQHDIRTKRDPVSALHVFERRKNPLTTLKGVKNPITTHGLSTLK